MTTVFTNYLKKISLLNQEEIEDSISYFDSLTLKKGAFFVSENGSCDQIGFILKGAVRNFSTQSNGEENTTCFKFEQQFITAYESFKQKGLSKVSIQAIENCDILVINYSRFHQLLAKVPAWKSILTMVMEQEYIEKEQHLLHYNKKSAKERYLHILKQSPEIVQRVNVGYLAEYLGVSHRTLSRVRKEMMQAAL